MNSSCSLRKREGNYTSCIFLGSLLQRLTSVKIAAMDKIYDHKKVEEKIYSYWEKNDFFKPEINPQGKPYSIILPPPNANGDLHFGHAMYAVEDILIRYHRMKGYSALWLPGTDHAGIETQFVFEKKL